MNERERFLQYMHFRSVDRIPLMEMGLWPETLDRWHGEGLPKWVTSIRHLEDYLRLGRSFNVNWLAINGEVYPPFEERVLKETEQEQVISRCWTILSLPTFLIRHISTTWNDGENC